MKRHKLAVEKRTVLGKKIKKLRKEGILPANIYGKDVKSVAVQLPYKDFETVYKESGETGLVDVKLNGQTKPCLIHNVHVNHYKNLILHADFYQVNLKEKVTAMIPIEIVGEAKAVEEKIGFLEEPISEIEVEALPTELPEKIEVNVEPLAAIDDQITVADIKIPENVTVLADKDQVVAKIGELVSKEAQEQAAAEAEAAEAAKTEAAAEAAEKPAEEGTKKEAAEAAPKPEEKTAEATKPISEPAKAEK